MTATESITKFIIQNVPSGSSSFTIKNTQDSTGTWFVGVDSFESQGGISIPVYWPGGVIPVVSTASSTTDIYSFKTFDGGNTLYGIVGGQNFS